VRALAPGRYVGVGGATGAARLLTLHDGGTGDARWLAAARALQRVEHAGILPVLEVGVAGEVPFAVQPLVDGRDAGSMLARAAELSRPLPVDVVALLVREVARALEALHVGERAHGAVRPHHVHIGWAGEVRLCGLLEGLLRQPAPTAAEDVASLAEFLLVLLGRPTDRAPSATRAPFVPPALLQVALRAGAEAGSGVRIRSAQGVASALTTYLSQDAPRTDVARVARWLAELFPDGADDDAARREAYLAEAAALPPAVAEAAHTPVVAQVPAVDAEREPGSLIDARYRIRRLCGSGGMGRVYEAEHEAIGRKVALKILHPLYSRAHDIAERFRREARAASRIGHPHIVEVLDFGTTEDGCLYIAMEFLDGRDLGQLLDELGSLPLSRALRIAAQICRALAAAHAAGIVHRDLKPENIYLLARAQDDFVKVLDFGIAKHSEEEGEKLTRPNIALGTPEYMAPEQVLGKTEPRSDLYAVGAMLYEMLTGGPPFESENYFDVFRRKAVEEPTPPSQTCRDVPPAVDRLILRALARKPEERQPSMSALADELDALIVRGGFGPAAG
jgi:serine/threonine protein kinase